MLRTGISVGSIPNGQKKESSIKKGEQASDRGELKERA